MLPVALALALPVTLSAAVALRPGSFEIVVAEDAPKTARFAAEELRDFLSQSLGSPVKVAGKPTAGVSHVFVGDSEWSRALGIDVNRLGRDAFAIRVVGGDVCIAGRDDPRCDLRRLVSDPHQGAWDLLVEHATLFGVYEFLERYAGVRMYFPGPLGTIVPRHGRIEVPTISKTVAPAFSVRNVSWYADGVWFEGTNRTAQILPGRKLNYLRQRMQTEYFPCCHGLTCFRHLERFSESHPEYFVLNADGTRRLERTGPFAGHLCHTSGIWDEIFADVVSYARGEDAGKRGLGTGGWPYQAFRTPWVDVMPQDGFVPCQCTRCQSVYRKGDFNFASELIWGKTAELARRIKAEGLPVRLTQMAYVPYRRVPDMAIPDNVDVMVAEGGPWSVSNPVSMSNELAETRGWAEKLGRKVCMWTYPVKFGRMDIPNIPNPAPRAWGRYYKGMAPWIFGAYAQSGDDRFLYNYLNYHVFGKLAWNPGIDVEALLEEHFRLMFGPAAEPMAEFVRQMEDKWINEVAGKLVESEIGPERQPPSTVELYTRVYSEAVIRGWRRLFQKAVSNVRRDSIEWRRIALYKREFYDPLAKAAERVRRELSVDAEVARRKASPDKLNMFVNGNFDLPPQGSSKRHYGKYGPNGWAGGWIGSDETIENISFVKDAPAGLPASMKVTVPEGSPKTVSIAEYFKFGAGNFKPGRRYRMSIFIRLDNVVSHGRDGGFRVRICDDLNRWFPERSITGTTGWFHQEYVFTAGPESDMRNCACWIYPLYNATGTVYLSGARFEEI